MVDKGILVPIEKEDYRMKYEAGNEEKKELTKAQQDVVDAVVSNSSSLPFYCSGLLVVERQKFICILLKKC